MITSKTFVAQILSALRQKQGIIAQRNDGKWLAEWDGKTLDSAVVMSMESKGMIEFVSNIRLANGGHKSGFVITDFGRDTLEKLS